MRIGATDIETAPATALVWRTGQQYVGLEQIEEPPRMISFAWRWVDEPKRATRFFSEWELGHERMVRMMADLLDEADAVVHFNGRKFDVPFVNTEIQKAGIPEPSPFAQIDLYRQTKDVFWLVSHKLQAVAVELIASEGKIRHEGIDLWRKVLTGDEKAQRLFRRYNVRDVDLLVDAYWKLLPWLTLPVHAGVVDEDGDPKSCSNCGGTRLERRGFAYTKQGKYPRYRCRRCGKWLRGTRRTIGAEIVGVAR